MSTISSKKVTGSTSGSKTISRVNSILPEGLLADISGTAGIHSFSPLNQTLNIGLALLFDALMNSGKHDSINTFSSILLNTKSQFKTIFILLFPSPKSNTGEASTNPKRALG